MATRIYTKIALDFDTDLDNITLDDIKAALLNVNVHDVKRSVYDSNEEDIQVLWLTLFTP